MTFGMCLLQDENGVDVGLLKKTHAHDGPVAITDAMHNSEMADKWCSTYSYISTLKECLRLSELGALAEDIDNTTAGESKVCQNIDHRPNNHHVC